MKMKNKHNKKRNTAFVFEALAREATVAIIKADIERKSQETEEPTPLPTGDGETKEAQD